jgi:hypothetical protein
MSFVGGVGTVIAQLRNVPVPEGWLQCNGACYDGQSFPELYKLLQDSVRLGDPPGYFRVPTERPLLPDNAIVTLIIRAS